MNQIDIADLDVIYLTYDEPQREEFWVRIRNMVPWAQRVDGVKGSDAAHKAAAAASTTERFVLIDGDNTPDPDFFNQTLIFPDSDWEQAVLLEAQLLQSGSRAAGMKLLEEFYL